MYDAQYILTRDMYWSLDCVILLGSDDNAENNRKSLVTAMNEDEVQFSAELSYNSKELRDSVPLIAVKVSLSGRTFKRTQLWLKSYSIWQYLYM